MNAILGPCHDGIMELRSGHYVKVVEITENTSKCLDEDYLVPTSPDVIYIYREREREIYSYGASRSKETFCFGLKNLTKPKLKLQI
jgi:hypothetical protein